MKVTLENFCALNRCWEETSLEQGPWLFRWLLCDQSPRGWTDWRRQPRHAGSDTGQADLADYRCCLRQVLPKGVNVNRELMAATFREKPQADLPASCCLSRPLRGGPDPRTETRLVRRHDTTSSLASEHGPARPEPCGSGASSARRTERGLGSWTPVWPQKHTELTSLCLSPDRTILPERA